MLGRFAQADTIVPGGSPVAWDRYAYGLDNPVKYSDPTGHYSFEEDPYDPNFVPAFRGINEARRYRSAVGVTQDEAEAIFRRLARDPLRGQGGLPYGFGDERGPYVGMRDSPRYGKLIWHAAYDEGPYRSYQVYPLAPGTAVYAGWSSGGLGNVIVIDHDIFGVHLYSVYGHLANTKEDPDIHVKKGDPVSYSTVIAMSGNTMAPGGVVHLHFEVRTAANVNLASVNPISGMTWWAHQGEDWQLYFVDLGQLWGYDDDNFGATND